MRWFVGLSLACWSATASAQVFVRQGGSQFSIEPIPGASTTAGFYGYNSLDPASAATGLETSNASLLFLYQGADGRSLVMLHDRPDDGSGGQAVFSISGLPAGAAYAVYDDPTGGGPGGDTYVPDPPSGGQTTARWRWAECCTDGAALRGLDPPYCIAIDPTFDAGINSWQLVSGAARTRTSLPNLSATTWLCQDCQELNCPDQIVAECDGSGMAWVPLGASGSSLCPGGNITNDRTGGGSDATDLYPLGTTRVTFRLQDSPGFVTTCTTDVVVEDTTPPSIVTCPVPLDLPCDGGPVPRTDPRVVAWIATFTATDSCSAVTLSDDVPALLPVSCDGTPVGVVFTATDTSGNVTTCNSSVTIVDIDPPAVSCPAPIVLECDDPLGVPAGDPRLTAFFAGFTATDDCSAVSTTNNAPGRFPSGCGPGVTTEVTYEATDGCARLSSCTTSVTVRDATAPEILCPADATFECRAPGGTPASDPELSAWRGTVNAIDGCGAVIIDDDLPPFVPAGCPPALATTVAFTATDACDLTASCSADVTISDRLPPEVTLCPVPLSLECDQRLGIPASDPRIQAMLASFAATDVCHPVNLSHDAPMFFDASCPPGTPRPVTFTATDTCALATDCGSAVTVVDSIGPALSPPADLTLECTGPGGIPATDPAILAWLGSATATDVCTDVAVADDAPGFFPAACAPGATTAVTFTATDSCANATAASRALTVRDTTGPIVTVPPPLVLECDDPLGVPASDPRIVTWLASANAVDGCGTATLTFSAPATFPAGCLPGTTTTVTFHAVDDCGNSTNASSTVTVRDVTAPELTVPAPLAVECNGPGGVLRDDPQVQAWLATATATDDCGGVVIDHDAPLLMPISCGTTPTVVTFSATDDCGNIATLTSSVTVVDTTPPDLTVPAPLELECNGPGGVLLGDAQIQAWLAAVTATDVCSGLTLTNDAPALFPAACGPGFATTVTFTATDDCGNIATLTSSVTVVDTTPPELTVPAPLELECNGPGGVLLGDAQIRAWLAAVTATDVCSGLILTNDAPALFPAGCGPGFATTVTFSATDDCGNFATLTSTVTVVDTTPPELTVPAPLELECNGPGGVLHGDPQVQAWLASTTAADVCDGATITHDAPASFPSGCLPGPSTPVTFTAQDNCANSAVATSSVRVVDTTPPEVVGILEPLAPLPPNSAAAPGSVCAPPSSRAFRVVCDVSDVCDDAPIVETRLLALSHDVPERGLCVARVESIAVECGEEIWIELLPPACPREPLSASSALTVRSDGVKLIRAEQVVLETIGRDDCGNATTVTFDPAAEPSPLCDERLGNGTCCPAIGTTAPDCELPLCLPPGGG